MREPDFPTFAAMLNDIAALLPPAQPLSGTAKALFFRALSQFTLDQVRAGLDGHVKDPQRGRFFPRPADVIAQIEGMAGEDGRPGAEEAWAIVQAGADEAATLVWTEEIGQAWGIAKPVLDGGDEVGARMAFREAYNRLVAEARKTGRPAAWSVTLGHDKDRREQVVREAVLAGRLVADEVQHLLPAPVVVEEAPVDSEDTPLLGTDVPSPDRRRRDEALAKLAGIAAEHRHPLDWARDLQRRDERGEALTEAQRALYREALNGPSRASDDVLQSFTPIPVDALPPAMRAELDAREQRA